MSSSKKTVFNTKNTNHKKGKYPIFLGQDLALYDTINIAYPELEELYLLQRSLGWTEDEVNLEQSRMDMIPLGKGGKTRQEEVDILVKAVSYLWEADSIASRSVISIFSPFLSNNEATAMMMEQTRFEVIHAKTYSEIVRQCVGDSSGLIDEIMKNDEILTRADTIISAFDDVVKYGALYNLGDETVGMEKYREVLLKGVFALLLLERVQFMSSFLVVFGLAEHDKFKGIADLVKLIARDENCLSGDHEVLTKNGWVRFDELEDGVEVAQWDYETRDIEFVMPNKVIRKKYTGNMHQISHSNRAVDQFVTDNHRIPLVNPDASGRDKKREVTAEKLKAGTGAHHIPVSGFKVGEKKSLTVLDKLRIAYQADGSERKFSDGREVGIKSGTQPLTFSFKRQRKIDGFDELLNESDYKYSVSDKNKDGYVTYQVHAPLHDFAGNDNWKGFGWIDYENIDRTWCVEFIDEIRSWDGSERYEGMSVYSNNNKNAIDAVQTIAHLAGYSTTVILTDAHVRESQGVIINANDHYRLSIYERTDRVANGQVTTKETTHVEDLDVYCVSVPSSFFLVKRNDTISVTGNCHVTMMATVINLLRRDAEWNDTFERLIPTFRRMVDEVYARELQWNEYLFSEGRSMIGLNTEILNDWVKYCVIDMHNRIGLSHNFGTMSNPISWSENWFNFDKVQNANQEADNVSYRMNSIANDLDNDEIFDI